MDTIVLENKKLRLEFSTISGALVGMTALESGWKIIKRPHLGLSFQLMVPMPGKRNNLVLGEKQVLTAFETESNGKSAVFFWDGVTDEATGKLDIKVWIQVELSENNAVFTTKINNNSKQTVESVYSPYIGDVQRPEGAKWLKTFSNGYASPQEKIIWPQFDNMKGYYGFDFPVQHLGTVPSANYVLLRSAGEGLYAGIQAPSCEAVAWYTELRPGYGSSIDFCVPTGEEISGKAVEIRFAAIHMPYIQPGETRTMTPVALEPFKGDWHKGVDIYKEWRSNWMKTSNVPQWAKEPHSWYQIHINSPEDELRIKFSELAKIGEDCTKHGVKAIQLVGWNDGGQDQGNPSHDPDPRLGTFEELKETIAKIQEMGVKVILFAKFTWADRATEWFRKDLNRLAVKDPYGDYYVYQGYQYQTAAQLLDINTKRLIPMCFLSEEYLRICEQEFKKTVELGADGILFDECQHHGPSLLCFDESHGHRLGAPVYANDRKLVNNFSKLPGSKQDFLFAGEACYDWEFEAYHLAYHRTESTTHKPLQRYMLPDMPIMTAVTGFHDRNMINQCLMHKYIISYEPYNFKGFLDDYPLTMEYGKKMDSLRAELRDYFWDGEFKDTCGAEVILEDGTRHEQYSVFINEKNGKPGLVICNYGYEKEIKVTVNMEDGSKPDKYRLVDNAGWIDVSEGIVIPPQSAAVIIYKLYNK